MQDVWSGVVDEIQAVKRSSVTPKPKDDEDLSSIVEALRAKARRHGELWGDHDSRINQLAREMHGVKTDFSWLHDHVMHVYGDRFKADEKDVKDLRRLWSVRMMRSMTSRNKSRSSRGRSVGVGSLLV
jgi:hypothetical protein